MRSLLPIVVALLSVSIVSAQTTLFDAPAYAVVLLRNTAVARELGLTPQVTQKIRACEKAAQREYLALISPTPQHPNSTRQPSLEEIKSLIRKKETTELAMLTSKQKMRLHELSLQYAGDFALCDPAIAKSLDLTLNQKNQVRATAVAAVQELNRGMRFRQRGNFRDRPGNMREGQTLAIERRIQMMTSLHRRVVTILTRAQIRRWQTMQGRPFSLHALYAQPEPL